MITYKRVFAVFTVLMLTFFAVTYEIDRHVHPHPVHAASQFANIICDGFTPVSAAADTQVITAGGPNNFIYICSYNFNAAAADIFSLVEGTGSVCGTNTKAMVGAVTAAAGLSLATNGTINYGGGSGAVTKTTVAGNNVCLLRTTAGPLSGVIGWTQASS